MSGGWTVKNRKNLERQKITSEFIYLSVTDFWAILDIGKQPSAITVKLYSSVFIRAFIL
jgi:hypothetical protein